MKAINSILVPTDFSPLALNAYRYALRLADALDASIDLMYVVPPISDNPGLGMFVDTQTATLQKKARHELEDFFREGIAGVNSNLSRVPGVETFVKVGDLRSSIRKHVEQEGNQLIVMGTGGRRSGWDDFLGTNASYLANHAPCPVLVIPPNTEYVAIESVCFATDLNDIATFQADNLLLALRPFQPTLNFLHVRSDERKTTDYDLQALREVFDRPGMSLQVDFASRKSEDVVGTVFAYAFETKCDLVVMHHPDRSWFRRLLSKSNTSEAVLHARLPLLIVTTYDSGGQKNSLPRAATQAQRSIALSWDSELLRKMDAYWRAANYLSIGQMYLRDNPLLERALRPSDIKPTLLGHWGTVPGQTFIYVHLNRVIREHDLDMMYISGPGHGGQAMVACAYLEGTYSEIYPAIKQDRAGLQRLFQQYSYPGGIPSHVSPECPGSIHEGGELGYSLSHAFGAVFDNPDLIVACVIGDGEAETGPLATSWHGNKFMNPITDGVVLPILHLNGYKIANPTILARIPEEELRNLLHGYGYLPFFVEGDDPAIMHAKMVDTLDKVVKQIREIQHHARTADDPTRPVWPMIVLRTPKGWTGPEKVDGKLSTGSFHAHQVPIVVKPHDIDQLQQLETWMRSYRPDELFDNKGRLIRELADLAPEGERRMSANPHANGGQLLQPLKMPDYRKYAVEVPTPGTVQAADTNVLGTFLRDIVFLNEEARNFRIFAPDELLSNRLGPVLEATDRQWILPRKSTDEHLAPYGRVVEFLSEHQCQGWLEGYLLTGRHGLFTSYEAFIHIVDSMVSQHAKWLKVTAELLWRAPIASLNYLLASHVWQQAHNGFTHQDPGFIDHVVNKKAVVVRVYLPPDANCLLSVWDHCQRSKHYINVVVAGKYQAPQWLNIREAEDHCARGIGVWHWASCPADTEPDLVMACCGDVPTLETLAAVKIFKSALPKLKIRVVNVVDLMKLQSPEAHPHGLSDTEFDALFTSDKPVVFAFHGYPFLIHRLTYKRANHANLHVHGYREEGTITTAFDMTVLNELDRFHLVRSALKHLPDTGPDGDALGLRMLEKYTQHKLHIQAYGVDLPEVRNWSWPLTPQNAFV